MWGPGSIDDGLSLSAIESSLEPTIRESLRVALEPFPKERHLVWRVLEGDLKRLSAAREALDSGTRNLWLHLQTLATVRRKLEPLHAMDTGEREVLELVLEFLDEQLGALLETAQPGTLVAVVSPYGLDPPDSPERLRRLLGIGERWRTTARSCPDGLLVLMGDNVVRGRRFAEAGLADAAPTICYLLGLPVAQYMEGRVVLDAIEPEYVATHPLRVVD
jgi:hypothetical protein